MFSLQGSVRCTPNHSKKPRILALHGARSNNDVTKLQLENLKITEDHYEIVYLRGLVQVEEGDESLQGLIHGPFYSWIVDDNDEKTMGESLLNSVRDVLEVVKNHGPFDGIYGFSSGAVVATLAASVASDPVLQKMVFPDGRQSWKAMTHRLDGISGVDDIGSNIEQRTTVRVSNRSMTMIDTGSTSFGLRRRKKTFGNSTVIKSSMMRSSRHLSATTIEDDIEAFKDRSKPFQFVILACTASPAPDLKSFREAANLESSILTPSSLNIPSFHLIGKEDKFKAQSEEFASIFTQRIVMYMPGGHGIGRDERSDAELTQYLEEFAHTLGNPAPRYHMPALHPVSEVSSLGLMPQAQVALVSLDKTKLPASGEATFLSLLKAQDPTKPFLYVAREKDSKKCTTYGDVHDFICRGNGDLRRLGVKAGEVVVYCAPPGGSAVAAVAFLSIGAQTTAAPLAPNSAEPDVLDALDQFHAHHLILFEGVDCPGIEAAFQHYSSQGKAKLHRARITGNDRPGLFQYIASTDGTLRGEPLVNPEEGTCLLLRTSGTTARPKGVPLQQRSLVNNGKVLASSMGLKDSDVCYSAMPLFHIGGISASILCTLATGGSVSCDGEAFNAEKMVGALALSNPQPTWYSAVPTIHNATVSFIKEIASGSETHAAYGITADGVWKQGHSLRMIRSGAAALLGPDGEALASTYGGLDIYPTYSMSEQMPISQPPAGSGDTLTRKPGSVGVPVAASVAIVNSSTLRPVAYGEEGEIAISGPTVMKNYLENPEADRKSYFELLLQMSETPGSAEYVKGRYFLTGDIGMLDKDGFLSLKGRAKELIKKGGEQVSPFEVEEPLLDHPWVKTAVCFAVPSKLYGEEVGCALVLSPDAPKGVELREVVVEMRKWMKELKMAPFKVPTQWKIVKDDDLPKTQTKKYIRVGLSTALGMDPQSEVCPLDKPTDNSKAIIDWAVLGAFRFILACYVMFMHIGSNKSWGSFNNLRGFPWHVHVFFLLGGFSMASPMNPIINKKFKYFMARIGNMYPMYAMSLVFGLSNLLIVCRPSTFSPVFHWDSRPEDLWVNGTIGGEVAPLFCEGTPATPHSYWMSLFTTVLIYVFGLAVTPFWQFNWWLGYYLWFSSMYYQCLAVFPSMYNVFFTKTRKQIGLLVKILIGLQVLNYVIILVPWFVTRNMEGYNHYDTATGNLNPVEEYNEDAWVHNAGILSFYLFSPFWVLYFVIGACIAFLYDAYRPSEKHNAQIWGRIADACTLTIFICSVCQVCGKFMRPEEANSNNAQTNRIWDDVYSRMFAPLTTLWVFALSTGQGFTANLLRTKFLSETLAPNAYNCFLFHQMVGQWYYAATRDGIFWNWWRYRKEMHWFSPEPCPVEWYEFPLVVGLVVVFSSFMSQLEPLAGQALTAIKTLVLGSSLDDEEEEESTGDILMGIVEGMTGIEPELGWTLEECGLASIGVPQIASMLNQRFSNGIRKVSISAADLIQATTIADMVEVVEAAKALADADGI